MHAFQMPYPESFLLVPSHSQQRLLCLRGNVRFARQKLSFTRKTGRTHFPTQIGIRGHIHVGGDEASDRVSLTAGEAR